MTYVDAAVRFTLAVLLNGLWEAALLACVAWLALRIMPNLNATTRHWVLSASLVASLVAPVLTTWIAWPHPAPTTTSAVAGDARALLPAPRHASTPSLPHYEAATASTPVVPALRLNLSLPRPVAIAIVAIWLAGAAFVLLRLFLSLLHLERLKHDALPVPVEYRAQLARWSAATKSAREVRLCRSGEIEIPIAVGLFDAMILVPERLLEELPPEDVDRIVLHELAHLRRADDWINAIERLAHALLFFNPGISWLVAQLDLEREVACDDWVLQQNEPLPYASCLAKVVESAIWPYRAMSAPGAFITRRAMSIRIERLLSAHRDVRVRTSPAPAGVALAAIAALIFVAALVSPSIAFTGPAPLQRAIPEHVAVHAVLPRAAKRSVSTPGAATSAPAQAVSAAPIPAAPTAAVAATAVHHVAASPAAAAAAATSAPDSDAARNDVADDERVAASSPDYVDELASVGYTNLSIDDLVRLKAVGVTGPYIRDIESAGFSHPTVQQLVRLSAMGTTPEYVSSMKSRFGAALTIDQLLRLCALGVSTAYLNDLAAAGYPNLSIEDAARLRAVGIDAAFVQRAQAHGFHNLTIDQLFRLKTSGILQ